MTFFSFRVHSCWRIDRGWPIRREQPPKSPPETRGLEGTGSCRFLASHLHNAHRPPVVHSVSASHTHRSFDHLKSTRRSSEQSSITSRLVTHIQIPSSCTDHIVPTYHTIPYHNHTVHNRILPFFSLPTPKYRSAASSPVPQSVPHDSPPPPRTVLGWDWAQLLPLITYLTTFAGQQLRCWLALLGYSPASSCISNHDFIRLVIGDSPREAVGYWLLLLQTSQTRPHSIASPRVNGPVARPKPRLDSTLEYANLAANSQNVDGPSLYSLRFKKPSSPRPPAFNTAHWPTPRHHHHSIATGPDTIPVLANLSAICNKYTESGAALAAKSDGKWVPA